jgi:hypothetical protein
MSSNAINNHSFSIGGLPIRRFYLLFPFEFIISHGTTMIDIKNVEKLFLMMSLNQLEIKSSHSLNVIQIFPFPAAQNNLKENMLF